ncbi:MAG: hypothetical protein ACRD1H_18385, partial [Vicinamibacterales bacterium]
QYFERGRMEIADASVTDARTLTSGSITQGLLVRELATGNVQLGYDSFVQDDPAPIALFGGAPGADAGETLTYADFAGAVVSPAEDRTGQQIGEWIAAGGEISAAPPPVEIVAGQFETATGHNVPDVTVSWLRSNPFGVDASEALGLPISEPYWARTGKGGDGVSLVQLFERRVVVYTPDLPLAERFSLTNAGRHYYRWRYGNDPNQENAPDAEQRQILPRVEEDAGLSLPDGYQAAALAEVSGVFDIAVAPDGRLALGYSDGRIELLDPRNPAADSTTLVEHLANPAAIVWAGADLYVADDTGVSRVSDVDGDGSADDIETIIDTGFERTTVQFAAGPEAALYVAGFLAGETAAATPVAAEPALYRVATNAHIGGAELLHAGGPLSGLVVDDAGDFWTIDDSGQLARRAEDERTQRALLDASSLGAVHDLILYRRDGTSGDPYSDMLALAGDRIVRLQPPRPKESPGLATPQPSTSPGAIVDFISGFDSPTALATGLDGSLYVLDTGRGVVYQIKPV